MIMLERNIFVSRLHKLLHWSYSRYDASGTRRIASRDGRNIEGEDSIFSRGEWKRAKRREKSKVERRDN